MPSLDQLLSRVVERKGFTVQGADQEALFARKGEETLLAAWKLDGPLSASEAAMFVAAMEQVRATTGILVTPKGVEPAAKELAASNKAIEFWAESRLVLEVGEALVRDACDGPLHHPAAAPAAAGYPATPASGQTPGPHSYSGANAFQATAEVQATNRTTSKFPSLVAQAASASVVSNHGAAYFMPNKRKEQPADMQAQIGVQKGGSLGYAWGGATGGSGAGTSNPGIAQVRSGKPRLQTDQWGNVIKPGQQAAAPAQPMMAPDAGVEIVSTPRRASAPAAPAPQVAPPVKAPVVHDNEAYEIITTKKKPEHSAVQVPAASAPAGCTTLKLNVGKDEAVAKTGKSGAARLTLVPHVAFEYDLEMNRPGMVAPVTAKGAVLVSSLTGELRTIDSLAYADSEPADARKDAEKLHAVDVYDKVKGHLGKTYTKTIQVEREVAGNGIMENVKMTPDIDEMGLEHKGIVQLPVWEITGSTGVVKVDAFTGAVL